MRSAPVFDCGALPRVLYFADTPIEDHMAFSTLYRVLENYPKNKLLIVEGSLASDPNRRIEGVTYRQFRLAWARLLRTRVNRYLSPLTTLHMPLRAGALERLVRDFRPEAVMTMVWDYAWAAAAAYAERAGLPLHLIVHDVWRGGGTRFERRLVDRRLQHWYPRAASRLCVSPYMAENFHIRYGASADVLYPSRSANSLVFAEPPERLRQACEPFTAAFAGRVQWDYAGSLQRMAAALRSFGGKLLVYGEAPPDAASAMRREPNIEWRGRVATSDDLLRQCRAEAHAMYVPMPYRKQDRPNAEISFPSKLADYTAIGLPLIVDGPEYCSAVRWARENPGVAEVITEESVEALAGAIAWLLQDPARRLQLAEAAIRRGEQYFGFGRAVSILCSKLSGSRQIAEGLHCDSALGLSLARDQP